MGECRVCYNLADCLLVPSLRDSGCLDLEEMEKYQAISSCFNMAPPPPARLLTFQPHMINMADQEERELLMKVKGQP